LKSDSKEKLKDLREKFECTAQLTNDRLET